MNIAELPIAGIALAQPDTSSTPGALSDMPGATRFDDFLSGLLGQLSDPKQAVTSTSGSLLQSLLSLQGAGINNIQGIAPMLTDGQGNCFEQLGQKLLSLVTQLLQGSKDDIKTDELMPLLDNIINSLASDQAAGDTKDTLIKLFANVKQSLAGDKLSLKLDGIVNGIPEMLKLKIRLSEHSGSNQLSGRDVAHIQYMLVAKLIGLAGQASDIASGAQASGVFDDVTAPVNEELMARFHITPSLAGVMAGSTGGDNESVDTAASAIDPSLIKAPNDQTSGNASDGIAPPSDQKGNEVKPAGVSTEAANAQRTVGQLVVNEAVNDAAKNLAHDKSASKGHGVARGAIKATIDKEAADIESGLADSQNGDQSTADSGATAVSTSSSTSSYAVAGENKQGFANEINQAMGTGATGNTGAQQSAMNTEHLLKQLAEKFDIMVAGGRSEAKIQLKPKHLGELKIHLIMENGTMRAVLDAPSHQVKEVLESNLSNLKQSLEDQGFHVKGFDVSVGHRQNNNNGGFARFKGARFMGERNPELVGEIEHVGISINLNGYGHKVVNYLA